MERFFHGGNKNNESGKEEFYSPAAEARENRNRQRSTAPRASSDARNKRSGRTNPNVKKSRIGPDYAELTTTVTYEQSPKTRRSKRLTRRKLLGWTAFTLVGSGVIFSIDKFIEFTDARDPSINSQQQAIQRANPEPTKTEKKIKVNQFNLNPKLLFTDGSTSYYVSTGQSVVNQGDSFVLCTYNDSDLNLPITYQVGTNQTNLTDIQTLQDTIRATEQSIIESNTYNPALQAADIVIWEPNSVNMLPEFLFKVDSKVSRPSVLAFTYTPDPTNLNQINDLIQQIAKDYNHPELSSVTPLIVAASKLQPTSPTDPTLSLPYP